MPRQARFVLPGELHHITQRGNYRQNVFYDDQDRFLYLKYLNENAEKYGVEIYAYCLMDNHVHFIVKPRQSDSLAQTFRITHQKYSLYLNDRLKEYGHRWQARFYSCVLLGEHISKAIKYVERNPVRAQMVKFPWHHPWSSARAHMGNDSKIIKMSEIDEYVQAESWENFLMTEDAPEEVELLRMSTQQGKAFGPMDMIKCLEEKLKCKLTFCPPGRPKKVTDTFNV